MTIAELNSLYSAVVAAIDAADYDTAIAKIMAMKARLASTPNTMQALGGAGNQSITWNQTQLDSLIADCRRQKAAAAHASAGAFVRVPVTYARPAGSGDFS